MIPLRVVARVEGQIALPNGALALDSLLASQVALRGGLAPPSCAADCQPIEIPVQREPGGRFHLCSFAEYRMIEHDVRWVNRRAPIDRYQQYGVTGKVLIQGGPDKSYRLPLEVGYIDGSELRWWCIGDTAEIRALLSAVLFVGKKRNVGLGRVSEWIVEECAAWPGFPVVREGKPLRPLPLDWPGLVDPPIAYRTLTYPYFDHAAEEMLACP